MSAVRHIDRRVLSARNKVEDGEVKPEYCVTARMLADIGTKALPDAQFAFLRDLINGYSLVAKHHPSYPMPPYVNCGGRWSSTVHEKFSLCMKSFCVCMKSGWKYDWLKCLHEKCR